MAETTTFGDDAYFDWEKAEALMRNVRIEIDAPLLGKRAVNGDWPHEIVFPPPPISAVEADRIRTEPFSGASFQKN